MKKTMIFFLMAFMVVIASCDTSDPTSNIPISKPVSGQIPSINKLVLEGTPLNGRIISEINSRTTKTEYNALQRLYDTVWFQTEQDEDDGVVEVETEFLFFKNIGGIVQIEEREIENGIMEEPDSDSEYETLTETDFTIDTTKLNAFVAKNTEFENGVADDEAEWEGYWLKDATTLYVIDGNLKSDVVRDLTAMIIPNADLSRYDDNKYLLSEDSTIVGIVPNPRS